ncbi:MAG: hypothetical protein QM753_12855 [Thermomicrobiales bacterium]
MTGPNLWGVFGRKAGTEAGFNYSDGLKAAGFTWDAEHIDKWIADPKAVVARHQDVLHRASRPPRTAST